ncbi:hypothetical protein [Photobacterium sp. J15]|uniref:hypothetical protein n=1 Tax=Photobacterium sp. J15 TaxID=265901 RepID=UPI0007E4B00D|nr:hypothetical protein [Photobacterium sp. J15]
MLSLSIPLPEELIQHYSGKLSGLDLFSATEFHSIFWFIKADAIIFYCIEALANKYNREVFLKVDGKSVVSSMYNYYINSLIKSGDLFIDSKVSHDFLSISDKILYAEHQLLEFGVLDEHDVSGEIALPPDCFYSISDKASIQICICDNASEEQNNDCCLYIKKDVIWEPLFRGSIEEVIEFLVHYLPGSHLLNRCPECGELDLVREMAYGEVHNECM